MLLRHLTLTELPVVQQYNPDEFDKNHYFVLYMQ